MYLFIIALPYLNKQIQFYATLALIWSGPKCCKSRIHLLSTERASCFYWWKLFRVNITCAVRIPRARNMFLNTRRRFTICIACTVYWSTYITLISTIIHKLSCVIWACNLSCCISTRMLVTKQLKGQLRWPVISSAIATWSFVTEGHVIGDIANSQLPENLGIRWQFRMISHVIWWRID